jgi:osmoprotectant transport system permease protein
VRRFLTVELPLAGPTLLAGLRVVAVSTVSLVTVGAVLGIPSLGLLFTDGFQRGILAEIITGIVLTVAVALSWTAVLVLAGRLLLPWTRPPSASAAVHPATRRWRMNYLLEALAWIADPSRWPGPNGIGLRLGEHLAYSASPASSSRASMAIPAGWWVGHTGRLRGLAVSLSGGARALPTLGLVTLLGILFGIGLVGPMVAFVVLALPSVLAGAYSGVESADRQAVDGARATGMTELQVLLRVEVPLGLPLLVGGVRSAFLQVIATATLAAYVGRAGWAGSCSSASRPRTTPRCWPPPCWSWRSPSSCDVAFAADPAPRLSRPFPLSHPSTDPIERNPSCHPSHAAASAPSPRWPASASSRPAAPPATHWAPPPSAVLGRPPASGAALVVGSQQYYSNEIIAELYAQALESAGFTVTRQYPDRAARDLPARARGRQDRRDPRVQRQPAAVLRQDRDGHRRRPDRHRARPRRCPRACAPSPPARRPTRTPTRSPRRVRRRVRPDQPSPTWPRRRSRSRSPRTASSPRAPTVPRASSRPTASPSSWCRSRIPAAP